MISVDLYSFNALSHSSWYNRYILILWGNYFNGWNLEQNPPFLYFYMLNSKTYLGFIEYCNRTQWASGDWFLHDQVLYKKVKMTDGIQVNTVWRMGWGRQ